MIIVIGIAAVSLRRPPSADPVQPAARDFEIPSAAPSAQELADRATELLLERNPRSLDQAIALYEQAHRLAPDDPRIRARWALALSRSVGWYDRPKAVAERAESIARQAVAESHGFEAMLALGLSLDVQGKTERAKETYERAMAMDPGHWRARASLAYLLQVQGRLVEALSHNLRAINDGAGRRLDAQTASCLRLLDFGVIAANWLARADRLEPSSAHAAPSRALDLIARGAPDEASAVIERALARGVEQVELYELLVVLALIDGDRAGGRTALERAPAAFRNDWVIIAWRGILDALDGKPANASEYITQLEAAIQAGDTWPENHLYIAYLEAAVGRRPRALAALSKLSRAGYRDHRWLTAMPLFTPLRGDPTFLAVIEQMRVDIAQQKAQALAAAWLPDSLRTPKTTLDAPDRTAQAEGLRASPPAR